MNPLHDDEGICLMKAKYDKFCKGCKYNWGSDDCCKKRIKFPDNMLQTGCEFNELKEANDVKG